MHLTPVISPYKAVRVAICRGVKRSKCSHVKMNQKTLFSLPFLFLSPPAVLFLFAVSFVFLFRRTLSLSKPVRYSVGEFVCRFDAQLCDKQSPPIVYTLETSVVIDHIRVVFPPAASSLALSCRGDILDNEISWRRLEGR